MTMFTLEQINEIHEQFGNASTLQQYLQALKGIGVDAYDSFIADGHSEYYGKDGFKVVSQPVHVQLIVAVKANQEAFLAHKARHEQGETNYLEMSQGFADSGVEKWTFDTVAMTITYFDIVGNIMLTEAV